MSSARRADTSERAQAMTSSRMLFGVGDGSTEGVRPRLDLESEGGRFVLDYADTPLELQRDGTKIGFPWAMSGESGGTRAVASQIWIVYRFRSAPTD